MYLQIPMVKNTPPQLARNHIRVGTVTNSHSLVQTFRPIK